MADIDVEKKGPSIWPWIIGLLVLALIIWAIAEMVGDDPVEPVADIEVVEPVGDEPISTPPVEPPPPIEIAEADEIGVADIIGAPEEFFGETVEGVVDVIEVPGVPTDRGFWIEEDGERLFAVIVDVPQEAPKDINPGQRLRIEQATVRDPADLGEMDLPGRPLDPDTKAIIQDQEAFLVVPEGNIEIMSMAGEQGAMPEADTDM